MLIVKVKSIQRKLVQWGYYKLIVKLGNGNQISAILKDKILAECITSVVEEERRESIAEAITYVLECSGIRFDMVDIDESIFCYSYSSLQEEI